MLPAFLLPEKIASEDGQGEPVVLDRILLDPSRRQRIQLTLGITRILERESLDVQIYGSADGERWRPLAAFLRKSFCGIYSVTLDLSAQREIRYLRTQWKMHRWGPGESSPLFSFYVWIEELQRKSLRAAS